MGKRTFPVGPRRITKNLRLDSNLLLGRHLRGSGDHFRSGSRVEILGGGKGAATRAKGGGGCGRSNFLTLRGAYGKKDRGQAVDDFGTPFLKPPGRVQHIWKFSLKSRPESGLR